MSGESMRKKFLSIGLLAAAGLFLSMVAMTPLAHSDSSDKSWMQVALASSPSGRERKQAMRAYESEDAFSEGALSFGNANGSVMLVEFGDYNCGYCRKMHETIKKVVAEDGDVHLVYREFPVLGRGSVEAARLVLAVGLIDKEKAKKLQDVLYAVQGRLGEQQALELARQLGLDPGLVMRQTKDDRIGKILSDTYSMSERIGFSGTPTLVANGEISEGLLSEGELREFIAIARANRG